MVATGKTSQKAAKKTAKRRRRGIKLQPTELQAAELRLDELAEDVEKLCAQVRADGGSILGQYREPLGGHPLLLVALPIEKVEPTPFQRDVSDAHVRRLTRAMDKTKRFLDPIIIVRQDDRYFTPNGHHRLTALRELGSRAVVGLLVPDPTVAYQILALNIEKAHNLRERALEVVRMYRDMAQLFRRKESDFELEFEEPALVTLGFAYQKRGRLAGGAYNPILRKIDDWLEVALGDAISERERRADVLLALDDAVNDVVAKLKQRGLTSPYLKSFVVARINPLRFIKGEPPGFDELLATMTKRARGMKVERIEASDLAKTGGAPDED